MNALAIAMVKNEADIVEAFVRHNLAFVDLMVVIDNDSTDGTREILDAMQREGLPLLIFDDPIFGYYQSEKVTHVYRKVAPIYQPELVYLLDADEFVDAPSREALESALSQLQPGSVALLPWATHVPSAEVDAARLLRDPLGAMPNRRRHEEPVYYKAVIRRRPEDDAELVIEQGNHMVQLRGGVRAQAATFNGVAIVHLPVRSVAQLSAKVVNGWHAYLVKNRHREVATAGFQWQQLYDRLVRGAGIDPTVLCQVALDYAQQTRETRCPERDMVTDPVASRYGALRYLALAHTDALAKVASNMESYLRQDARVRSSPAQPAHGRDLAPLLALTRQIQAATLATTGDDPAWLTQLVASRAALRIVSGAAADLLLVPDVSHATLAALAATACGRALRRIVYWPAGADPHPALRDALTIWYRHGWEPHLAQTLGARALASYAAQRGGAIVFQPVDATQAQRATVVRELLCALDAARPPWTDPAADCIRHPMQDLRLDTVAA